MRLVGFSFRTGQRSASRITEGSVRVTAKSEMGRSRRWLARPRTICANIAPLLRPSVADKSSHFWVSHWLSGVSRRWPRSSGTSRVRTPQNSLNACRHSEHKYDARFALQNLVLANLQLDNQPLFLAPRRPGPRQHKRPLERTGT